MASRTSWILGVVLLSVCIALSGLSVPLIAVEDGLELLTNPTDYEVAERSLSLASILMDHPAEKVLFPAARIESIHRHSGQCDEGDPGYETRESGYRVVVRFYTFFAIPGPRVVVRCGGFLAERV